MYQTRVEGVVSRNWRMNGAGLRSSGGRWSVRGPDDRHLRPARVVSRRRHDDGPRAVVGGQISAVRREDERIVRRGCSGHVAHEAVVVHAEVGGRNRRGERKGRNGERNRPPDDLPAAQTLRGGVHTCHEENDANGKREDVRPPGTERIDVQRARQEGGGVKAGDGEAKWPGGAAAEQPEQAQRDERQRPRDRRRTCENRSTSNWACWFRGSAVRWS